MFYFIFEINHYWLVFFFFLMGIYEEMQLSLSQVTSHMCGTLTLYGSRVGGHEPVTYIKV